MTVSAFVFEVLANVSNWDKEWEIIQKEIGALTESKMDNRLSNSQKKRIRAHLQVISKAAWLQLKQEGEHVQ